MTKRQIAPWLALGFCTFLSTLPLASTAGFGANWWQPAFYSFLPLCFFYSGVAQYQSFKDVDELRNRLAALEAKGSV